MRSAIFAILILAAAFLTQQSFAQKSKKSAAAPPPSDTTPVFSAETREVPLNVTVSDHNGHFVTTLPQTAFQVFENNVLQTIKVFRREDLPVSLCLVVDNSGSMREKRQAVEAAALALVKDSNPQDESCVINFNIDAFLDTDFTGDIERLRNGLERIDSRGETAMREALRLAIEHLHEKGKRDKKVVIVVTDGNDNASDFSIEKLVLLAQKNDITHLCHRLAE